MADSSYRILGYARRGVLIVLALLLVTAVFFGGYQWNIYHRNMAVSDANLPPLPPLTRRDRILILSPHPDDETLGAGGLMAMAADMGAPVRVVFLTNGDGSLATRLVQDAHFVEQMARGKEPKRPRNIYRQIAPMRQKEAEAALSRLRVPAKEIIFLGYPDGGTKQMWETNWSADNVYRSPFTQTDHSPYANSRTPGAPYCGRQVLDDVTDIISRYKPTIVVTTNPSDTHPDHWAAYAYLSAAVAQLQLQQKNAAWANRIKCYTFIVHHGFWPAPHGYHPDAPLSPPADLMGVKASWMQLPLSEKEEKAKTSALQQYKSQLATTPQFLRGFLRRNELFAQSNKEKDTSSWQQIIQDPPNDLLMPQLISAADITSLSIKKEEGKVLSLRVALDGKAWKDVSYQIAVHAISSNDVSLRRITIAVNSKNHWQCTISSPSKPQGSNSPVLNVAAENSQLRVQLPLAFLGVKEANARTFLISATSFLRNRPLDQTPTAIVDFAD